MAAIFPKSSDLFIKVAGLVIGIGALTGVAAYAYYTYPTVIDTGYQPVQPVPYSHKLHAGTLGLDCFYCHSTVYKAAWAMVPATETCMNCHVKVKPDSPRLEPVRQSFKTGQPIPWVHVHVLPDFVYFNHQSHVTVGVSCVSCHGRIDQEIEVHQEKPLNMAFCLDCHKDPAPNVRPVAMVTKLDWAPDPALGKTARQIGEEIIAEKHLKPPTNCSGCHR
jgi:menaquinone reductase, multiheme cytochrome c subunit